MGSNDLVALLGAAAVLSCCFILVFNRDYDDGFFGRLGLTGIALVACSRIFSVLHGDPNQTSPMGVLLWAGLALFLVRHTSSFLKRCRRKDHTWYIRNGKKI